MEKMGNKFAAEYKLDGERAQIHVKSNAVKLFSRSLEDITRHYPDIVEKIPKNLKVNDAILEAEVVAINEDSGEYLPFQELMHRRRKYKVEKAVSEYPITVNFFDLLYLDGKSCLEVEYTKRREMLQKILSENEFAKLVPMTVIQNENEIEDFLENSINSGCEGLMLKMLDASYKAGARANSWLKLKREYKNELGDSIDLIVIGFYSGENIISLRLRNFLF